MCHIVCFVVHVHCAKIGNLKFWKESHLGIVKVIFTKPVLVLGKLTFD